MFAEFHPQCTASAAILSQKKVSERDSEPRDPTDAVKDWVKSVGVLKADPENPFGDDLEFYHVQAEAAFRDSGYYDGIVDKSPFDLKPSVTALINKGLSEKEAAAVIDAIVAKANKSNNKIEKETVDDVTFVPGLDKCFTEKSDYDNEKFEEIRDKNMNENAVKSKKQEQRMKGKIRADMGNNVEIGKSKGDNKLDRRPKSLERDVSLNPVDIVATTEAKKQDDSSPDSEYQSGKESLASESDNTNEAQTPGSEVESSVDTGEVFTNNDNVGTESGATDIDKAAENCVVS